MRFISSGFEPPTLFWTWLTIGKIKAGHWFTCPVLPLLTYCAARPVKVSNIVNIVLCNNYALNFSCHLFSFLSPYGSSGRIRTSNRPVTVIQDFRQGLDYPITLFCNLGGDRLVSTPSCFQAWLGIAIGSTLRFPRI